MIQSKPWVYTEKIWCKTQRYFRDVKIKDLNGCAKLVKDTFEKIRCLPGHKPIVYNLIL